MRALVLASTTLPYFLQFHAAIVPLQSMLKRATVPTVSPAQCGAWFCFPDLLKSFDKVAKISSAARTKNSLKITPSHRPFISFCSGYSELDAHLSLQPLQGPETPSSPPRSVSHHDAWLWSHGGRSWHQGETLPVLVISVEQWQGLVRKGKPGTAGAFVFSDEEGGQGCYWWLQGREG